MDVLDNIREWDYLKMNSCPQNEKIGAFSLTGFCGISWRYRRTAHLVEVCRFTGWWRTAHLVDEDCTFGGGLHIRWELYSRLLEIRANGTRGPGLRGAADPPARGATQIASLPPSSVRRHAASFWRPMTHGDLRGCGNAVKEKRIAVRSEPPSKDFFRRNCG